MPPLEAEPYLTTIGFQMMPIFSLKKMHDRESASNATTDIIHTFRAITDADKVDSSAYRTSPSSLSTAGPSG